MLGGFFWVATDAGAQSGVLWEQRPGDGVTTTIEDQYRPAKRICPPEFWLTGTGGNAKLFLPGIEPGASASSEQRSPAELQEPFDSVKDLSLLQRDEPPPARGAARLITILHQAH
jgi:hypothetical protein